NHGGRADETLRATIDSLPEVLAEVKGREPVIVDSGFRRGTDVFKALALGATAVGIGRPYIWGLGAFGQAGVERVLEILNRELRIVMMQMGATSVAKVSRRSLQLGRPKRRACAAAPRRGEPPPTRRAELNPARSRGRARGARSGR